MPVDPAPSPSFALAAAPETTLPQLIDGGTTAG
jgi:hypothetical protein